MQHPSEILQVDSAATTDLPAPAVSPAFPILLQEFPKHILTLGLIDVQLAPQGLNLGQSQAACTIDVHKTENPLHPPLLPATLRLRAHQVRLKHAQAS
eukprot:CAMPEP_0204081130 /NCGR_PEP_ID=MMETSP0360-20130528/175042_1 /ASSEMBLY_ACC=CAM_ASM_000342 /TAXON_ID=268821 /ORGANISM="Scrippsiella Hangoei, Strain SHTV-5" /LENGTH=97 /DNA_ID=CAMNT_0051029943 /DNA_START=40 /DNA_END=333 /DNA_ORIENTATION=+